MRFCTDVVLVPEQGRERLLLVAEEAELVVEKTGEYVRCVEQFYYHCCPQPERGGGRGRERMSKSKRQRERRERERETETERDRE